jgi:demethylmenaquinone methyltransferase/2-methoxy-6-polyprenyl-1,4-benzoquinol methylase
MADELHALLAEQLAYYRARAGEYDSSALPQPAERSELVAALRTFGPRGAVLEFAPGTGRWTLELARTADCVTAVDASPEMLAIAAERVSGHAVRLIEADLFGWRPEERYDVVFFAAWLSHVPPQRFDAFWALVADCLAPGGRVFVIDETPAGEVGETRVPGAIAPTVDRPLTTGEHFRAVKVFHEPEALVARLAELGWVAEAARAGAEDQFFTLTARRSDPPPAAGAARDCA